MSEKIKINVNVVDDLPEQRVELVDDIYNVYVSAAWCKGHTRGELRDFAILLAKTKKRGVKL